MKSTFLLQLGAFCAAALTAFAAERPVPAPGPELLGGGLQVSLSTGGYKFIAADAVAPVATAKARLGQPAASRDSFAASALLVNRSGSEVGFVFPNPAAAERHWTFRVFDSAGELVWESDADVIAAQVTTEAKLGRAARWKRNILVPLKHNGEWLAPGSYTLEASIDADRQLGATAIFQVVPPVPKPEPEKTTGIKGRVTIGTGEASKPFAGALVEIRNALFVVKDGVFLTEDTKPFFWTGSANDLGEFQVLTPPGRFDVRLIAHTYVSPGISTIGSGRTVTVENGRFSEVALSMRDDVPIINAPVGTTGVQGQVRIGPISPVAVPGEPSEAPLAGIGVRVEEILKEGAAPGRPAFSWTGITDREGRFKVATPPGRFLVTASNFMVVPFTPRSEPTMLAALGSLTQLGQIDLPRPKIAGATTSAEVAVEAGRYSEVILHIDSGIR